MQLITELPATVAPAEAACSVGKAVYRTRSFITSWIRVDCSVALHGTPAGAGQRPWGPHTWPPGLQGWPADGLHRCVSQAGVSFLYRGGGMRLRWMAAGLLQAEPQFRRVRGHRLMPALSAVPDANQGEIASPPHAA